MRLPATGLTLPWQLVAAQEPGPMYFTGSAFASAGLASGSAGTAMKLAGWAGPFLAAAIRTAKVSAGKSAAHSVARSQLDWGTICIRDDGFVRPIIVWKMHLARCLFRGVARKGNGASIYRAVGQQ
jgi:hypothetical protein